MGWELKDLDMLPESSSDWRKGSINSSLADRRSETFAIHLSINALTPGSFTFANDAGLIPFKDGRYNILALKIEKLIQEIKCQ